MTGIPCPSCGLTSAFYYLLQGNITGAIAANPLVLLFVMFVLLLPLGIAVEVITRNDVIDKTMNIMDKNFKKPVSVLLVVAAIVLLWLRQM